jgi:hypothetical protein
MHGMTGRPQSRGRRGPATRVACGIVLALAAAGNALAAGAVARAGATVLEAVQVRDFIGAPVTVQDLLAAWHASAGPQTGLSPIRLPDLAPPPQTFAGPESHATQVDPGLLQAGLVADISAISPPEHEDHVALLFITVAFN